MPFNVSEYRDKHPELYGDSSLREVAQDLFDFNPQFQSTYKDVDDWAERDGLKGAWDTDEANIAAKRHHRQMGMERQQNLNDMNFATRSVARGWNQTQAMLGGAIGVGGDLVGSDSLRDWGIDSYRKNIEEASLYPGTELKEIVDAPMLMKPVKAGQWALEKLGENIPNIGLAMATGGTMGAIAGSTRVMGGKIVQKALGGMLAKSVRNQVAGKGILKKLSKQKIGTIIDLSKQDRLILQAADRAVIQNIAAKTGVVASTAALESGGMYGEGADEGFHNPVSAMGLGILAGMVEVMGGNIRLINKVFGKKTGKLFGEAVDRVKDAKAKPGDVNFLSRVFREAAKQAPAEAGQEAIQETLALANHVINTNDPGFEVFSMENLKRVGESALAGGAVGLLFGAGTGTLNMKDAVDRYDTTDGNDPDANRELLEHKIAEGATTAATKFAAGELEQTVKPEAEGSAIENILAKLQAGVKPTPDEAKLLSRAIERETEKTPKDVLAEEIEKLPEGEPLTIKALSKSKKAMDALNVVIGGKPEDAEKAVEAVPTKPEYVAKPSKETTSTPVKEQKREVKLADEIVIKPKEKIVPKKKQAKKPKAEAKPAKREEVKEKIKAPWQVSLLEYGKSRLPLKEAEGITDPKQVKSFSAQHAHEIKSALDKGENVPENVLTEYRGTPWADAALKDRFTKRPADEKQREKAQTDQTLSDLADLKASMAEEAAVSVKKTETDTKITESGQATFSKPGDKKSLMGEASTAIKTHENEGLSIELWKGDESGAGYLVSIDESGNVAQGPVKHSDFNHMEKRYDDDYANLSGIEKKTTVGVGAKPKPAAKADVIVGKNSDGTEIKIDKNGGRYIIENGIKITPPAKIHPNGSFRPLTLKELISRKEAAYLTKEELKVPSGQAKSKRKKLPDISGIDLKGISVTYKERIVEDPTRQHGVTEPADGAVKRIDDRVDGYYQIASCMEIRL